MSCWSDPLGCVVDAVSGTVSDVAGGVFDQLMDGLAGVFADTAAGLSEFLWDLLDSATGIDLGAPGMNAMYGVTAMIGLLMAGTKFLIQIAASVLRQEGGGLALAVRGLVTATVGMVVAVSATAVLLTATDALANGIMEVTIGGTVGEGAAALTNAMYTTAQWGGVSGPTAVSATAGLGALGTILYSIVIIVSSVILWVAMMVRKMLLIIAAIFAPIAFAGAPSLATKTWIRKWISFVVALALSKLVLVILFVIGLTTITSVDATTVTEALTNLAAGVLTLCVAAFAPWIALKFVTFVGGEMAELGGTAAAATQTAGRWGGRAAGAIRGRFGGTGGGGKGSGGSDVPSPSGGKRAFPSPVSSGGGATSGAGPAARGGAAGGPHGMAAMAAAGAVEKKTAQVKGVVTSPARQAAAASSSGTGGIGHSRSSTSAPAPPASSSKESAAKGASVRGSGREPAGVNGSSQSKRQGDA